MALDKFRAAPLPNPPAQYDPQYVRQLIRVLENYFSQLDSRAANNAEQYSADRFIGGSFSGTEITANNVATTRLDAIGGSVDNLTAQEMFSEYTRTHSLQVDNAEVTTLMADNVYANMFYGDGRFIEVPYNQFQSFVDQTAAAIDQAYALRLEITDFADGIFIAGTNDTQITFSEAGVYSLNFSLSFKNTTNDAQTIDVWFRYNGTDVANSNSRFSIPARKSTGDPSYLIAVTAYTGIAQSDNDYVEIMWRVSDINVTLEHLPAVAASAGVTPAIPGTPSALVQASFVSAQYPPAKRVAPLPVFGFGQVGAISVATR